MKTIVSRKDGQRWSPAGALSLAQQLGMGARLQYGGLGVILDGTVGENQGPLVERALGHSNFEVTIVADDDPRIPTAAV